MGLRSRSPDTQDVNEPPPDINRPALTHRLRPRRHSTLPSMRAKLHRCTRLKQAGRENYPVSAHHRTPTSGMPRITATLAPVKVNDQNAYRPTNGEMTSTVSRNFRDTEHYVCQITVVERFTARTSHHDAAPCIAYPRSQLRSTWPTFCSTRRTSRSDRGYR